MLLTWVNRSPTTPISTGDLSGIDTMPNTPTPDPPRTPTRVGRGTGTTFIPGNSLMQMVASKKHVSHSLPLLIIDTGS